MATQLLDFSRGWVRSFSSQWKTGQAASPLLLQFNNFIFSSFYVQFLLGKKKQPHIPKITIQQLFCKVDAAATVVPDRNTFWDGR